MLPSGTTPNSSAETTLTMLAAKRCSLMAMAAPSISREAEVTTDSSFTTSPARPRREALLSSKSRSSVWPAERVSGARRGSRPVKKISRMTSPAGREERRKVPVSSVSATRLVPRTVTRALFTYWPVSVFWTRPVMEPVVGAVAVEEVALVWAESEGSAAMVASARMAIPLSEVRGVKMANFMAELGCRLRGKCSDEGEGRSARTGAA